MHLFAHEQQARGHVAEASLHDQAQELSFDVQSPGNVTLHAGPVPATVPDMPIALTAQYVNFGLSNATVQMPSRDTFVLTPAPPDP